MCVLEDTELVGKCSSCGWCDLLVLWGSSTHTVFAYNNMHFCGSPNMKPVHFLPLTGLFLVHMLFSWPFLPLLLLGFYSCHLGSFKTWWPLFVVVGHLLWMAFFLFHWILGSWKIRGLVLWVTQCSLMLQTVWLSIWIMAPYPDMSTQIYLFLLILKYDLHKDLGILF